MNNEGLWRFLKMNNKENMSFYEIVATWYDYVFQMEIKDFIKNFLSNLHVTAK